MHIRAATAGDATSLLALRNHYIATSFGVFDEAPLTDEAVLRWMASFSTCGPYRLLVAVADHRVVGFASSQRYRDHPAFQKTIETSIYIDPHLARSGIGSALYAELFASLKDQALHRAVVGIALPNEGSVGLHTRFGFTKVGVFDEYATKNGRYISSVWMQRPL
jgi:phosphinothricin acetyltransferase